MIETAFIQLYEELSTINEAKQDTLNFTNYFLNNGYSEEEATGWTKRFDNIKKILKAPENDYYYWIKKKTTRDLIDKISDIERYVEVKRNKKAEVENGAELIHESEHWKIYHITNFEASQVYGRDTQWCITGIGSYGDRYWNDYTDKGFSFYFVITKDEYDPRGTDSKFALAVNHGSETYQVFNQQDTECNLDDIPYYEELNFPGIDLSSYSNEEISYCEYCNDSLHEDDIWWGADGEIYCEDCFNKFCFNCADCGDTYTNDKGGEGTNGAMYCYDCWIDHFFECSQCGETGDLEDAKYDRNGDVYCSACYEDMMIV